LSARAIYDSPFTFYDSGVSLKVLQLSSARAFGGGERHLADLCRELAAPGFSIHLAHRPQTEILPRLPPSVHLHALPLRNAVDLFSARRLARIIREHEIDILHAHLARDYPPAALAVRLAPRARLVITRHVMFPLSRWHALTLGRAAKVIAVSAAVAGQLQSLVAPEKIRIIHNGINLDAFDANAKTRRRESFRVRHNINPARLLVGALGDLNPLKGPDDFLRAAAQVAAQRADTIFLLAGPDASGANRPRLENLARQLGLTEKFLFLDWVEDTAEFYAALDVFVSASRTESFGLTIVEAMASGLPVVATRTAGAEEIIRDNHNGRLAPSGEPNALAEAVSLLLAGPHERLRLSEQAQTDARERFSLARMVAETEKVYEETLSAER
jgi:glycosyltransferase involved in cell wall biosynthesis